jgi:hypothetical protein
LKQLIQSASGEHSFTYHTLRHSAFNHLYLVLKHSPLADAFDYTPNDQLRIRYALLRNKILSKPGMRFLILPGT